MDPWRLINDKCRGAFVQVRDLIQSQFPGTEVLGTGYPVPLPKASNIK